MSKIFFNPSEIILENDTCVMTKQTTLFTGGFFMERSLF